MGFSTLGLFFSLSHLRFCITIIAKRYVTIRIWNVELPALFAFPHFHSRGEQICGHGIALEHVAEAMLIGFKYIYPLTRT